MNKIIFRLGLLSFLLAAGGEGRAQGTINMTTTAVPFLRINPDTRGSAMGETGIATKPDANSGSYNLAKLPFMQAGDNNETGGQGSGLSGTAARGGGAVDYTPWLHDIVEDMYLLHASGYYRPDDQQALGASVRFFSLGDVQVKDFGGNLMQNSHPEEYSMDLGYARKLSAKFSLALAMRYIHSHLASGAIDGTSYKAGNAAAADVSLFYTDVNSEGRGFSAGLALTNLGTRIGYTSNTTDKNYLPAQLGIGIAYTFVADEQNRLSLGVDGTKLLVPVSPTDSVLAAKYYSYSIPNSWIRSFNNNGYSFSGGAEYSYAGRLFLRAGYYWEDNNRGGLHYLTAGLGLRYSQFGLNFSYVAPSGEGTGRNPLSNTFRFGLTIN